MQQGMMGQPTMMQQGSYTSGSMPYTTAASGGMPYSTSGMTTTPTTTGAMNIPANQVPTQAFGGMQQQPGLVKQVEQNLMGATQPSTTSTTQTSYTSGYPTK